MLKTALALAVAVLIGSLPARADEAAAKACAASLPAASAALYTAAKPDVAAGSSVKDALTKAAKAAVAAGTLKRGDARSVAQAAGTCLLKL